MNNNLIECARCGKFFQPQHTNEEATEEFVDNFGEVIATSEDEIVVICDDCYEEIHPKKFPEKVKAVRQEILKRKNN